MGKQLASVAQFRRRRVSTVAILAQGTIWAVAASQAFFGCPGLSWQFEPRLIRVVGPGWLELRMVGGFSTMDRLLAALILTYLSAER